MSKNYDLDIYRNRLRDVFMFFAEIPKQEMDEFLDKFYLKVYPKKSLLISPGNKDLKGFFILKGLVWMYYIKKKRIITSDFREENSFFLNGYTTFTGLPNFDYFKALEETICLVIDWNDLENMLKKYHLLEHLGRKIVEWHYVESMRVSHNTLFLNADERYTVFMNERASLLNRVSLKQIASYLGVTQETLSRLRAKHQQE